MNAKTYADMVKVAFSGGSVKLESGEVLEWPDISVLDDIQCAKAAIAFLSRCDSLLGGSPALRTLLTAFEGWLAGTCTEAHVNEVSQQVLAEVLLASKEGRGD